MKHFLLVLAFFCILISCKKADPEVVVPAGNDEDPDWIKLEIPGGREAFSVAGDIDKTLLVSTLEKAYYTTDKGKTWLESRNFQGPIPGLLIRNDTTFALNIFTSDKNGNPAAWDPQYFTPDYGKTWFFYGQYYKYYMDDRLPIGVVESKEGIRYFIEQHATPVPNSNYSTVNPSEIKSEDKKGVHTVHFPFKQRLINLYLDSGNHLYVAASGGTYQPESNSFYCCTPEMPGIVYVSRKPLP